MSDTTLKTLLAGVANNTIVPYLGAGALAGSVDKLSGVAIPADSDSLILAMNGGKPMSKRLMWEFPRAAMDVELKRGRKAVHNFLEETYGKRQWTRAPLHDWLASIEPHYVIDSNRDTQLQDTYADQPHTLIRGTARISGTNYRFVLNEYVGSGGYREITQEEVNPALPILFKPMGSPRPDANYIASDADYVDYITELMGGFAIPDFLKEYRKGKQYLFIGMRLQRDTDRMVMSDITYAASEPKGWALIPQPTDKEVRFCARQGIEIITADVENLLAAAGFAAAKAA
ncbi:MAG: SIR2 family protein [Thiothrix sp.]|uniref:SIR2 family protein n=1 Tax=Thiothrix sp. TaxID=1032 RepID=UPI0026051318|nr:SIR2 family protein [Thiothrix sp.]MDD5394349.1 SIR2 family protein [Thiothrix sp.]